MQAMNLNINGFRDLWTIINSGVNALNSENSRYRIPSRSRDSTLCGRLPTSRGRSRVANLGSRIKGPGGITL